MPWHSLQLRVMSVLSAPWTLLAVEPNSNAAVTSQLPKHAFPTFRVDEFFAITMIPRETVTVFYRLSIAADAVRVESAPR